ncbi:MAG: 1-aminocyclopropane-1-carboxylate deaminase/D-cysteine desulfhydrase [Geodermatophilaceae bacterium]
MTVTSELPAALERIGRVELATLPTPLHQAHRLSEELGVSIWFKRDDLTGIGLGGNKVRTLEYLLADAISQGCDCLVTGAGAQSNWTMLAALTAARCGLEPFVVCYGDPVPDRGNLLLHRGIGTSIRFTGDPERSSVDGGMQELATQLRGLGRRPYVVPRGGATPVGALGYVRASLELAVQLAAIPDAPTTLWLAAGSGGTCAGLVAAAVLLRTSYDVVGVTVSRPVAEITAQVAHLATAASELIGMPVEDPAVDIRGGWIGPEYGAASPEGDRAAALVARTECVFLDPVFGAKAMAALIDACRSEQLAGPVIFLVSGGAPTLFSAAPRSAGASR